MLFNSLEFLLFFLPIVLALYYALPARGSSRLVLLTLSSYVFCSWLRPVYCWIILGISIFDYIVGRGLARAVAGPRKKLLLIASLVANLGLLAVFKYSGFAARSLNGLANAVGASGAILPIPEIILPIGLSFHTFQSMSYTIDVYRGHTRPARSLLEFLCFVAFFPQLVAGPVVRFVQVAAELESREHSFEKAARGAYFFVIGLAKKVLIADAVAPLTSGLDAAPAGALAAWIAAIARPSARWESGVRSGTCRERCRSS